MVACQMLLLNRSPHLEDLGTELFERARRERLLPAARGNTLHAMQRAVAELGFCDPPQRLTGRHSARASGGSPAWAEWAERWHGTSTLSPRARGNVRTTLLKAGRWLEAEQPQAADPASWTRQTCAAWVAAVDRMKVGDYLQRTAGRKDQIGKPLEAATKAAHLAAVRTFFRDLQEWEQIPRRFDPQRALAVPRSIAALLGPDPRVIADDIWAKLMWAGLNLEGDDLPQAQAGDFYPLELVQAVTLAWLFSGQRSDEIARLRVGCIRWQHDGAAIAGDSDQVLARDAVCLLDVPAHKTGTAFTKPVDPVLGQALDAWQAVRPAQPKFTDRRTGELVDLLFAFRARKISTTYINNTVIPVLCRKAGVPAADVRGNITSHRARSTIATQLYNAKEPMTLFELQAWLGHRSPQSTQFYAKISPATLTRAYDDAGLLRPQRPHHRGPRRPRRRHLRRRRGRRALAALRPRPRLLHLHLLRAVPAPHGLRQMRLLHPEGLQQGPAPRGQGEPAEDAGDDPAHRGRAGRRRRRQRRPRQAAGPAG